MKASIDNPVVIAVIKHDDSNMNIYEVLDWGSNEWLDVQYKNTCYQFKKSSDLEEMKELALNEMGCGEFSKEGYKIELV